MTPIGSRLASGGRELDTYAPYAGLDSGAIQGIHILFDQATVSPVLKNLRIHVTVPNHFDRFRS